MEFGVGVLLALTGIAVGLTLPLQNPVVSGLVWALTLGYGSWLAASHRSELAEWIAIHSWQSTGLAAASAGVVAMVIWWSFMVPWSLRTKAEAVEQQAVASQQARIELNRRRAVMGQLTRLYINSHDGISPEMLSGLQYPPADWVNAELRAYGEQWTYPQGLTDLGG